MPLVIDNQVIKDKCQIFTPELVVSKMLDLAEYNDRLYGKRVLENSCGNGEILVQIVERYIEDCKKRRFSKVKIKAGLEKDIIAYEIDKKCIKQCLDRLDVVALRYKIKNVNWNVNCNDFLASKTTLDFQFIIGNPPYIAYPDLQNEIRHYIKANFQTCRKGKFDYCYAFIEKSYEMLSKQGVLVYIIPSNIFKNVFAFEIRNLIKDDLISIIDYPNDCVFDKVLVSPAIIKVKKNSDMNELLYTCENSDIIIDKSSLQNKWIFSNQSEVGKHRLSEDYKVSSSVATLLNEAFILKDGKINCNYYEINGKKIELQLLRKAASPKNKKYNKYTEYIIFPYYYNSDGALQHYSENEMYDKFPFAMEYLEVFKDKLQQRDADKKSMWYEYGRSQALQYINQPLILISSVVSECTRAYLLSKDEIPYSGLYIVSKGEKTLESLVLKLNSTHFKSYINKIGVCVSGSSKRITPSDIENYFYEELKASH